MNQRAAGPEFAMSFTQDAVCLERREGLDWRPLGQAQFSGGGMAATLNALRDEAGGAEGLSDTVLVIPDDQILYTSVTVPVGSDTPTAIGRLMESMTPYRAEDLAFDWCPSANGDIETLRVAAVARRTLDEAEDFARAQGFRPSGYVARPGDDRFDGQPDFGPSKLARQQKVERPPFTQPDLSHARVTAPVIEDEAADQLQAISRIPPHVVLAAPETAAEVASPVIADASVPVTDSAAPEVADPAIGETVPDSAADSDVSREQPIAATVEAANDEDAQPTEAAAPVIRHGNRKTVAAPAPVAGAARKLSPRAEAVHARAEEARARRAAQPETVETASILSRLRGFNPGRLSVMMGGLVALLVLVLALFGTSPDSTETANAPAQSLTPTAAPEETPETQTAAAPEQAPEPLPASETPADTATADVTEQTTDQTAAAQVEGSPAETTTPQSTADLNAAAPEATEQATAPQGDDALSRALTEAMESEAAAPAADAPAVEAAPSQQPAPISAATMASEALENAPAATPRDESNVQASATPAATAAPTANTPTTTSPAAAAAPASAAPQPATAAARRLASSARPPRAAPSPAASPAAPDASPAVPANPLPLDQLTPSQASSVSGTRPRGRPAATRPESTPPASQPASASVTTSPAPQPAPAAAPAPQASPVGSSPRPPSRPDSLTLLEEGSASEATQPTRLTKAERDAARQLLRDLRTAELDATGLSPAERGALIVLADARPTRKPVAIGATTQRAVEDAVAAAVESTDRPETRSGSRITASSDGSLSRSARPSSRPGERSVANGGGGGPGNASLSRAAIDNAIASAVSSSTARPGAVALTALSASALPPRRSGGGERGGRPTANTTTAAAPQAPTADDLRSAAQAQQAEAALAEQRRQDAELQAQAEARARAQAASDARAEAQARAQAEARARAQAQAEAQAAARRQQAYVPPEAEKEPEVNAALPDGRTTTTAAATATVKDGIQINRTQIIGTIGAGKASRALVRLSNGRVLTLRLGDKINGGTITDIGNSRITFVKGGRAQALAVLNGQ